jgi:hypothetical protein
MQVKELIEQLQGMNPDAEVHMAYGYGDYWNTEVAPKIDRVDMGSVVYSDYHRMDKIAESDDSDFDDETLRLVVVLS